MLRMFMMNPWGATVTLFGGLPSENSRHFLHPQYKVTGSVKLLAPPSPFLLLSDTDLKSITTL